MPVNNKTFKAALTNVLILLAIIFVLEGGARIFLYLTRAKSTVGMQERRVYLSYQPFVMFGPDWNNVLLPEKFQKNGAVEPYRILLLGNSFAYRFPKEILEEAFGNKFKKMRFEVINAGYGAYNARQELILAALWAPRFKPEMIITIDGGGDLIDRLRMDSADTFYLNKSYELLLKKPFLSPFFHILRQSQFIFGINRLMQQITIHSADNYSDAIPVYISAQHSLNVIAKGLSAKRIMVLQPFMAFKNPLSEAEANFKYYDYRKEVIKNLYNLTHEQLIKLANSDEAVYLDTRFLFDGVNDTVFSDDMHFIDKKWYRVLAEAIVESAYKNNLMPVDNN